MISVDISKESVFLKFILMCDIEIMKLNNVKSFSEMFSDRHSDLEEI